MVTKHAEVIKKIPGWLYKTLAQKWYDPEFPRHLFIELTTRCNLSCEYCPRIFSTEDMEWTTFTRIVKEASSYGPRSFSLHLFGEPLLYPYIIEACQFIKRSNPKHTIILTTNGTELRNKYKELEADKIIWSYKKGQTIPKEAYSWKNLTIRFLKGEEKPFPRREIRRLHNYGGTISPENSGALSTDGKRWPCYHLWYAPSVSANGDILICCADPMKKTVIGNVKQMRIAEAWKKMETFRMLHKNSVYQGICAKCDVWKVYPSTFFSWQYTT